MFPGDPANSTISSGKHSQPIAGSDLVEDALARTRPSHAQADECSAETSPIDSIDEKAESIKDGDRPHELASEQPAFPDWSEPARSDAELPTPEVIGSIPQSDNTPAVATSTPEDNSHSMHTPMLVEEDSKPCAVENATPVLIRAETANNAESATNDNQRQYIDAAPPIPTEAEIQESQPIERPAQTASPIDTNVTTTEENQIELAVNKNTSVRTYQRRRKASIVPTENPTKSTVCVTAAAISEADIVHAVQPPARRGRPSRRNANKAKQQSIETDSSDASICTATSLLADTMVDESSIAGDAAKRETAAIVGSGLSIIARSECQAVVPMQADASSCDVMEDKAAVEAIRAEPMVVDGPAEDQTNGK